VGDCEACCCDVKQAPFLSSSLTHTCLGSPRSHHDRRYPGSKSVLSGWCEGASRRRRLRRLHQQALARFQDYRKRNMQRGLLAVLSAAARRHRDMLEIEEAALADRERWCVQTSMRVWRRYFARHVCSAQRSPCARCRRALLPVTAAQR
jgi:hypothetical protein